MSTYMPRILLLRSTLLWKPTNDMYRNKDNGTLPTRTTRLLLPKIQDKAKFHETAFKTPHGNKSRNPKNRHAQISYSTGTTCAIRRRENDCANDISPCTRANLKRCPPETGLISKVARKLRFPTRRGYPRKGHLSGKGKRPVKFVTGIGIMSEEDLSLVSWNTAFSKAIVRSLETTFSMSSTST